MHIVSVIFELLLILAMLGFFGAIGFLVLSALAMKNSVVNQGKRLSEPPIRSVKTLLATGKGIAQQETVRFKHVAGSVKSAAGAVKVAVAEVKTAAEGVHPSDLKPVLTSTQTVFKFLSLALKMTRAAAAKPGRA